MLFGGSPQLPKRCGKSRLKPGLRRPVWYPLAIGFLQALDRRSPAFTRFPGVHTYCAKAKAFWTAGKTRARRRFGAIPRRTTRAARSKILNLAGHEVCK